MVSTADDNTKRRAHRMPRRTSRQFEVERRRQLTFQLYLRGHDVEKIAAAVTRELGEVVQPHRVLEWIGEVAARNVNTLDQATLKDLVARSEAKHLEVERLLWLEHQRLQPMTDDDQPTRLRKATMRIAALREVRDTVTAADDMRQSYGFSAAVARRDAERASEIGNGNQRPRLEPSARVRARELAMAPIIAGELSAPEPEKADEGPASEALLGPRRIAHVAPGDPENK